MLKGNKAISLLLTLLLLSGIHLINTISINHISINFLERANATFPGGNGTLSNPFQISNLTQLQQINDNLSAHYILICDIDANNSKEWNWNGTAHEGFYPIGNESKPFKGSLNGQGYSIYGLTINRSDDNMIGLFGYIDTNHFISNLTLEQCRISGLSRTGSIAGYFAKGSIKNVTIDVKIDTNDGWYIGGVAGYMQGSISNCIVDCNITANYRVGGMVGNAYICDINNSSVRGVIYGKELVGGIAGGLTGNINNSFTDCIVTAEDSESGGFVGLLFNGVINNSHTTGKVLAGGYCGGLIGASYVDTFVNNSYSNCSIMANYSGAGGLIGSSGSGIENSYFLGIIEGEDYIGGLIGMGHWQRVENSYYCIDYSTINGVKKVAPFGIYKLQFDDWRSNSLSIDIDRHLNKDPFTKKYAVNDINDIKIMLAFSSQKYCFIQKNDIDFSLEPNLHIPVFLNGEYDGGEKAISNVSFINSTLFYEGIFGYIGENAKVINVIGKNCSPSGRLSFGTIAAINYGTVLDCHSYGNVKGRRYLGGIVGQNIGLVDSCTSSTNVDGRSEVGSLVGKNYGEIIRCQAKGDVNGTYDIGGITGSNEGIISKSFATGKISGESVIGGLVGYNSGTISICYSSGNVIGNRSVGGFAGGNSRDISNSFSHGDVIGNQYIGGFTGGSSTYAEIKYCYSTGKVTGNTSYGGFNGYSSQTPNQRIIFCFYDVDTSGVTHSSGGTGLSTNDMKKKITYSDAYWDLKNIWMIKDGQSYPELGVFKVSYKIRTLEHLNLIRFDSTADYFIMNDINATPTWSWDGGKGFHPIEGEGGRFAGTIDGLNHNISGLYINRPDENNIGLFAHSWSNFKISNINIINAWINGNEYVGGLVGVFSYGYIENCSFTGRIAGNKWIGAIVGKHWGNYELHKRMNIINSFYCINDTALNENNIITKYGIYKTQYEDWIMDKKIEINDYFDNNSSCGSYIINNERDLKNILPFTTTKNDFIQTSDIEISYNSSFYIPLLMGVKYDGRGHSLKGITIQDDYSEYLGLFGYVGRDSEISNLHVIDCDIRGWNYNGGLAGRSNGLIVNCSSSGYVEVHWDDGRTGGLIGLIDDHGKVLDSYSSVQVKGGKWIGCLAGVNQGSIDRCFSSGSCDGDRSVGGLVGVNYGYLNNSYSTGDVISDYIAGGLVGLNDWRGKIRNCYSVGKVTCEEEAGGLVGSNSYQDVVNSFWDITSSGISVSDGGTGLSKYLMQQKSTFEEAGWDMNNTWLISDGKSYPFLRIFYKPPQLSVETELFAYEDVKFEMELNVNYFQPPEGSNRITYKISTDCHWLDQYQFRNGLLTGTPTNYDVGSYHVGVNVTDSFDLWSYTDITLIVINENDPPVLQEVPIQTIMEDEYFGIQLKAEDIDLDQGELNWSINTNGKFLDLNNTGYLSGTPTNDDIGSFWVEITVKDNHRIADTINFTLIVGNVNDPPIILGDPPNTAIEDEPYHFNFDSIDIDPGPKVVFWALHTSASFLTININTGNLTGLPKNNDVGTWWVNITAADIEGGVGWKNFTLTVMNTNDKPTVNNTDLYFTMEEDSEGLQIELYDIFIDVDGDLLAFDHSLSSNLSISIAEDIMTIIPKENWFGKEMINIIASDEYYSMAINMTINVTSINDAPENVVIVANSYYFEGQGQYVNSSAEDVDIPYGDTLSYRWSSNVTGDIGIGRSINLSLPPGLHLVKLTVTDNGGLSANATMEILIKPIIGDDDDITGDDDSDGKEKKFPILILIIIGFIILLIVALIMFILMRKKKPEEEQPTEPEREDQEQVSDPLPPEETFPTEQESFIPPDPELIQDQEDVFSENSLPEVNDNPFIEPPVEELPNDLSGEVLGEKTTTPFTVDDYPNDLANDPTISSNQDLPQGE